MAKIPDPSNPPKQQLTSEQLSPPQTPKSKAPRSRPAEIVNALFRLGYLDAPPKGDHCYFFLRVIDHPEGPITLRTQVDMGPKEVPDGDVRLIRRQTRLDRGNLWDRALDKDLLASEYMDYLRTLPKADLVPTYYRNRYLQKLEEDQKKAVAKEPDGQKTRKARKKPKKQSRGK